MAKSRSFSTMRWLNKHQYLQVKHQEEERVGFKAVLQLDCKRKYGILSNVGSPLKHSPPPQNLGLKAELGWEGSGQLFLQTVLYHSNVDDVFPSRYPRNCS